MMAAFVLALAIISGGCEQASSQSTAGSDSAGATPTPASGPPPAGDALPGSTAFIAAGPEDRAPSPKPAQQPGEVVWHTYAEGLEIAKREKKPIMLFVHADWCSKCRALRPLFAQPEFKKLAEDLVMVQQNADEEPAWLDALDQQYGTYVPRVFFMKPDGTVREELKSPSPRYPYFYTAGQASQLQASMRLAVGGAG